MHIHYTQGPDILSDISVDVYTDIISYLNERHSNSEIQIQFGVSDEVINAIRDILRLGLRRCVFCGSLFNPKGRTRANTCGRVHYLPCIDCGVPVEVKESYANYIKAGGRRCSQCRSSQIGLKHRSKSAEERQAIIAKQEATMLGRYGARNALQVPEIKARVDATVRKRYGVQSNISQSKEIQEKIKKNSQQRFGVDHYSNDPEIRQRMVDGMLTKYGV